MRVLKGRSHSTALAKGKKNLSWWGLKHLARILINKEKAHFSRCLIRRGYLSAKKDNESKAKR